MNNEIDFIDKYSQGSCEVFALAMHDELGYDIYLYIDNQAGFETDDGIIYGFALIHAFTKDNKNQMYDVNGKINETDLDSHANWVNDGEIIKISRNELFQYANSGLIAKIDLSEVKICRDYIRNNNKKYRNVLY